MDIIEVLLWSSLGLLATFYFIYYVLMLHESRKPDNILKGKRYPKLSLLIPTYNEESVICRKLSNVETLDYPKEKLEVIVVDSASTDSTQQLVQSFIGKTSTQFQLIVQPERLGKASALNCAVQYCHGDIVLMTDADAILEKDALKKIAENFNDPNVGAATGRLFILNADQSSVTKLEKSYRGIYEIIRLGESRMDSTLIFNGPITAFRRQLFDELKPDTVTDDIELCIKIRKKGYRAVYDPGAIAYEYTPISLRSRMHQKTRRAQGAIQSIIRHKSIVFNRRYGKYGFVIFPCELFMHLISPILLLFLTLLVTVVTLRDQALALLLMGTAIILVSAMALFLFVLKTLMPDREMVINPLAVLVTFFSLQISLIFGFSALLLRRKSYRWQKIEDVRVGKIVEETASVG